MGEWNGIEKRAKAPCPCPSLVEVSGSVKLIERDLEHITKANRVEINTILASFHESNAQLKECVVSIREILSMLSDGDTRFLSVESRIIALENEKKSIELVTKGMPFSSVLSLLIARQRLVWWIAGWMVITTGVQIHSGHFKAFLGWWKDTIGG